MKISIHIPISAITLTMLLLFSSQLAFSQDCPADESELENATLPADGVWDINSNCGPIVSSNALRPMSNIIIHSGGTLTLEPDPTARVRVDLSITIESGGTLTIVGSGEIILRNGGSVNVNAGGTLNATQFRVGRPDESGTLVLNGTVNVSDFMLRTMGVLSGSGTLNASNI